MGDHARTRKGCRYCQNVGHSIGAAICRWFPTSLSKCSEPLGIWHQTVGEWLGGGISALVPGIHQRSGCSRLRHSSLVAFQPSHFASRHDGRGNRAGAGDCLLKSTTYNRDAHTVAMTTALSLDVW